MKNAILSLAKEKESALVLSLDVSNEKELLSTAEELGDHIVILKTHIDILEDFNEGTIKKLKSISERKKFFIFEDRKFADIPSTSLLQYTKGVYKIAEWADIINAHTLPGPKLIEVLKTEGLKRRAGCLLLAEMSTEENLITEAYTHKTLDMALKHPDFIIGFISQKNIHPDFLHFTPGVSLSSKTDGIGQQYRSPEEALERDGCDFIIVGRAILKEPDRLKAANDYKCASFRYFKKKSYIA